MRPLLPVAVALLLTGCAVSTGSESVAPQTSTTPAVEDTPEPSLHELKASDLELTVKTTSKHCFGSAGCNVEYKVKVAFAIPDPGELAGDYDVTFKVLGDEDGPIVDTFTIYSDGKYDVTEGFASTKSSNTKLTAKVAELDQE